MKKSRVLLVSSDRARREEFLETVRGVDPGERFDVASGAFDALKRLAKRSYRAAVCIVESPDEIAVVVRLKKARHDLPVLMMTSIQDPTIDQLGRQLGADVVLRVRGDGRRNAEGLIRVLEATEGARLLRRHLTRTRDLIRDVRQINRTNRELIAEMLGLSAACERGDFSVLVVEDTDTDYLLLARGLGKSGLPPVHRRACSAEEALQYLRGEGLYRDRSLYPMPSLVISDLNLPGMSGLDLLRAVREDEALKTLGFILYTSSEREQDVDEAGRLGANFYVVKSSSPDPVAEILHSVFARFIQERSGLTP